MRDFFNVLTVVLIILCLGVVVIFKLLPSSYFFTYEKVIVDNPEIPTFRSYMIAHRDFSMIWNDVVYCDSTRIPLPKDYKDFEKGYYLGEGTWTAYFDVNAFRGSECYLQWRAYPTLFGLIKGQQNTGFTESFILQ